MKKLFTVLFLFAVCGSAEAKKPVFYSWGGETIEKVADFPDTYDYRSTDGYNVDAGFRYKQVTLFFVPVWNYDIKWCGYISDAYYVDLDRTQLEQAAKTAGVKLPDDFPLSFWDKYGGKLVFIVLIGVALLFKSSSSDAEADEETTDAAANDGDSSGDE